MPEWTKSPSTHGGTKMTGFGKEQRLDLHNVSIDEELVTNFHRCGQIHLPSGRRCIREEHHQQSCSFAGPEEVAKVRASSEKTN